MVLKRYRAPAILFVVSAGALLIEKPPGSVYANAQDTSATQLTAAGSFAITSDTSLRVQTVASGGKSLFFLLTGSGYTEILIVDSTGSLQNSYFVESGDNSKIDEMSVSQDNRVALLRRDGQLETYSQAGERLTTIPAGRNSRHCGFVDQSAFVFGSDGVTILEGPNAGQKTAWSGQPFTWQPTVFGTGIHRVGVLDAVGAVLSVLDTQSGKWQTHELNAPEIQSVSRPAPAANTAIPALSQVAVDPSSGDVYGVVSPYNVNQGATILRFNTDGVLKARLHCPFRTSSDFVSDRNKDGHFSMSDLVVADQKLLLVSISQRRILSFPLS